VTPTTSNLAPRLAATLVPLRDHRGALEVLLTTRPDHMRFMGGAVVFPGGAVARADLDPRWERASTLTPAAAATALHTRDQAGALGAYVCALRESFEEVGLLLGRTETPAPARSEAHGAAAFLDACLARGVVLATDRLVPAGRWVTPPPSPIRFDTRFFLAEVPRGWEPVPDPSEVAACRWSSPRAALEELATGRAVMAPPTIEMLQRLASFGNVESALAEAGERSAGVLSARLSPLVQVILAPNPGALTGPGTNTYVVGRGPTVVIDPADGDPAYLDAVCAAAGEVESIVVTHRHPDHVGGVRAMVVRTEAPVRAFGPDPAGGVRTQPLAHGAMLQTRGAGLRVLHTPGHARDHICLLLEEEAALFAGDVVMGEGTPVISPPDGSMRMYLDSLERLASLEVRRIYPGHFRPLDDPAETLRHLLQHRREREAKILLAIAPSGSTLEDIVERAYEDTDTELHGLAARSALAHLEMLEEDGQVRRRGRLWGMDAPKAGEREN
jgi:glyoxylase-like metal-dependent hydrolase (beta-lactamase superfamily II)/8-oxo-dGTP pyrophosphatase MutT (NUDIX family)